MTNLQGKNIVEKGEDHISGGSRQRGAAFL
jgi:hypothetical protein